MENRDAQSNVLVRAMSGDGSVAVRALAATSLVAEAARRHGTSPVATVALGRALMGAVLLAAGGKDGERLQLRFQGDGPLSPVMAMADCDGRARGSVGDRTLHLPLRSGRLDVGGAVGQGQLVVVRQRTGWREPYTGIVPIVSGEIGEDLALYLTESEQTPAAVGLGVHLAPGGGVAAAGGFLAEALPEADDAVIEALESNVRGLPSPADLVRRGGGAEAILDRLLLGLDPREVRRSRPLFHCGCTEQRVLRAIALLGREEVESLCTAGEPVEVRCELCGEQYRVDPERARSLLRDA